MAFANANVGREFQWGIQDCNTVALRFLDFYMKGNPNYEPVLKDEVEGKYGTPKEAYRFYKGFRYNYDEWLDRFCEKNPEKPVFQAGDIILCPVLGVEGLHVCLGGNSLSVNPEHGTILVPTLELLEQDNVRIYRPNL